MPSEPPPGGAAPAAPATPVRVHLQEGFRHDEVQVAVDGAPAATLDDVTTNLSSNIAAIETLAVALPARLTVALGRPPRSTASIDLPAGPGEVDVVVQIERGSGEVTAALADEPPTYL